MRIPVPVSLSTLTLTSGINAREFRFMRFLYNLLLIPALVLASPYYFWKMVRRGNWQKDFAQRLGIFSEPFKMKLIGRRVLWLHAVSVGEVNVTVPLVTELLRRLNGWQFIVSTTTATGMSELKKKLPPEILAIYCPIDCWPCRHSGFAALNPTAVVLVEAEIWPNMVWQSSDRKLPLFLVNARISDKSFSRYKQFASLFSALFGSFTSVGAQNFEDSQCLRELGCAESRVAVTGNMKYDAVSSNSATTNARALLQKWGVAESAPVLVAGSTHDGEERLLAESFRQLRRDWPDLVLIIVPRHQERSGDIATQLTQQGFAPRLRSQMDAVPQSTQDKLLIVDSTGELMSFYEIATVVFVGKSITAHGGQNPIEPAALGKPAVFGPHMENFRAISAELVRNDVAIQIENGEALTGVLRELFASPERRRVMGENARRVVAANSGATLRTADLIESELRRRIPTCPASSSS